MAAFGVVIETCRGAACEFIDPDPTQWRLPKRSSRKGMILSSFRFRDGKLTNCW